MRLLFDIETDGLIDDVTVVHCINIIDLDSGKRCAYNGGVYTDGTPAPRDGTINDGLYFLALADELVGHNILNYDIPVLRKLHDWNPCADRIVDTRVCAQVIWPEVKEWDFTAIAKGSLDPAFQREGLIGKHGLEAWGYRLGSYKGDFKPGNYTQENGEKHTWKTIGFTKDMDEYGRQDVEVNLVLLRKIESKQYSQECLDLEHRVAEIISRQILHGFAFDMDAALALVAKLQKRHAEIAAQLTTLFEPWYMPDVVKGSALFTPKGDNKKLGYTKGCPLSKVKHVVFNGASRDHIADRLMKVRGWKPTQYTDSGKPQVDETTLEALPWPEAKVLAEYLMVEKRLGQIADGKEAWVKHAKVDINTRTYRIHGNVTTNGAVTGRMTHASPNVAQTPRCGTPYGEECRACWVASPNLVLVGCDADGLELRMLAHYLARYDGGAYVKAVDEGRKEDGTDAHTINQRATRLNKRDSAKTFVYALIYGAGDFKLGTIAYDDFTDEQRAKFNAKHTGKKARATALARLGGARREALMTNLPALGQLVEAVKDAVKARGYLRGLDGRLLHIRGAHAALNTLLQSAGALVMKRALVLLEEELAPKRSTSTTVAFVANIHDEWQIETNKEIADDVGRLAADSIRRAGESFGLRCPLKGNFGVGTNWKETH